jgi:hypothetical protein
VYEGSGSATDLNSMIYIQSCKGTIYLEHLTFKALVITENLITIDASQTVYPAFQTTKDRAALLAAAHIKLEDVTSQDCSMKSLMYVNFGAYFLQNVKLLRLNVSQTAVTRSLIQVYRGSALTSLDVNGGMDSYAYRRHTTVVKAPSYFTLEVMDVKETYWQDALFSLSNLANVVVSTVQLHNSGSFSGGIENFGYKSIKLDPSNYIEEDRSWPVTLKCSSTFSLFQVNQASVSSLVLADSTCDGVFGVEVTSFIGKVRAT